VYCGQTVGWIKMKLGMEVGLSPGHIVLDRDPPKRGTLAQPPHFSVHVCCGQTAGWIKMPLGTEVGLGPGDIVLDGDPAPPQKGRTAPPWRTAPPFFGQTAGWTNCHLVWRYALALATLSDGEPKGTAPPPIFGPSMLWIVLDGDPASPKKSTALPLLFGPCLLWPNGWMDQDATWYRGGPQPRPHCVKWAPSSPQKGSQQPPSFRPCLFWPNGCPSQLLVSTWFYSYLLSCCIFHIILPLIKPFN